MSHGARRFGSELLPTDCWHVFEGQAGGHGEFRLLFIGQIIPWFETARCSVLDGWSRFSAQRSISTRAKNSGAWGAGLPSGFSSPPAMRIGMSNRCLDSAERAGFMLTNVNAFCDQHTDLESRNQEEIGRIYCDAQAHEVEELRLLNP